MSPYDRNSLSRRFAHFLVNRPLISFAFAFVLMGILIPGIQYVQADFSYRIWFRESDSLLKKFDAFERRFGNDENVAVIVHSPSGIFDKESVTLVQELTEAMWLVPEIIRVDSLANYNWTHAEGDDLIVEPLLDADLEWDEELLAARKKVATEHEIIPGYLLSPDARTAVIYAELKPAIGGTPDFETVVEGSREVVKKFEGRGDHIFHITGGAPVTHTFKEVTQADLTVMVPILFAALLTFLFICFRRLSGMLLPTMVIFCSITMTMGFAGWTGIPFNNLTSVVPHILIAISVADAVHILVTFFQFRRAGIERKEAARKTLIKNLKPTLLTSVSTSIGFFSFLSAKLIPIVTMGLLAGTGTFIAWLITIFLLAPMMAYLPIEVKKSDTQSNYNHAHPLAVRYTGWLATYRMPVIALFAVLVVSAAYIAVSNEVNANPFKYFAEDVPTRVANEFAEKEVGGMLGIELVLDSGVEGGAKDSAWLHRVDAFQSWVGEQEHITKTIAITDIVKQVNRSLNGDKQEHYIIPGEDQGNLIAEEIFLYTMSLPQGMDITNRISLDERYIRLTAMCDLHDSKESLIFMDQLEKKAEEMGLTAWVTGKMPLYHQMNPYVVDAFVTSISLALVLVSFLMLLVFRDWKIGLLSMIPNTVPLVFGGALMTLLNKPLDIGTVLVTSTCLGIAVDDTIHFLSNYLLWRRQGASRELAVAHVITHTGPALFVTTLVLVVGFSTFAFSSFVPNINFGIMTAIVLSSALITDATLLPALLLRRTAEDTVSVTDTDAVPA
ncbi:MAG: MMPL family transporter [Acidobacteriota bacterium]|nr:MMPL family transporter [Acidobacteriota bacterium]